VPQSGIDIRCLRIVVIAHASDFRDKLEAMLDAANERTAFAIAAGSPQRDASPPRRKDVFELWARPAESPGDSIRLFFAVMAKTFRFRTNAPWATRCFRLNSTRAASRAKDVVAVIGVQHRGCPLPSGSKMRALARPYSSSV